MHPNLKPGWKPPTAPEGFPTPCVIQYEDGTEQIDFLNDESKDFASEEDVAFEVEWPWEDEFKPSGPDWEAAGFWFISARPCPHH